MKKYKKIKYEMTISIDNKDEEWSAKRIIADDGRCWALLCEVCPFLVSKSGCFEADRTKRLEILKEMGFENE